MSSVFKIEYSYANGEKLTVENKTFTESVKMVLNGQFEKVGTPLKVFIPSTNKTLYFDDDYFRNFIQGSLEMPELIENTECDGLYRNKIEIETPKNREIEPDSLWKKQGNYMILVDGDKYIQIDADNLELFKEI